jgi:hypothetical protein
MQIRYEVTQDGTRINSYPEGVLDWETTSEYFNRLTADTRIKSGAIEIVHFTNVTDFKISYAESINITQEYQKPKEKMMIQATIFICESDLAWGIGRMLQTIHSISNPDHRVEIVRSPDDLEELLKTFA